MIVDGAPFFIRFRSVLVVVMEFLIIFCQNHNYSVHIVTIETNAVQRIWKKSMNRNYDVDLQKFPSIQMYWIRAEKKDFSLCRWA